MKKVFLGIAAIFLITLNCCAGAPQKPTATAATDAVITAAAQSAATPNPPPPSTMTLDAAIKEASDQIDGLFAVNSKIALINFTSPSDQFSAYVLDELTANLVTSRKLEVIDRKEVDLRRSELNFQMSGDVDDNSIQELGRTLGAQNIVSGSLTNLGDTYRIVIRALNVESGRVEVQYRNNIANDNVVKALLAGGKSNATAAAEKVLSLPISATVAATTAGAEAAAVAKPEQAPEVKTYKIGDTGPAGGLIFYDKGNNTGGWRYLEAAPADLPNPLIGATEKINCGNAMERAVGKGKSNTEAIMKEAVIKGGGFGWAAQAADSYSVNGFDDWFLPSRDELHWMYGHLHMQGLGSFNNDTYYSSTANYNSGNQFWGENFETGNQDYGYNNSKFRVRPIRQF